ncbi:Ig-like domain-containing protein, partial [Nanoarchaeota archaeon]
MKIKRVFSLLIILLGLILAAAAASATITINEFIVDGPTPEPASEWIELYNNDTVNSVWLLGWNITDGEGYFTLPAVSIPANGFIILANNQTVFNNLYTTSATVVEYGPNSVGTFVIDNAAENLDLYDPGNNQIDTITFGLPSENVTWGRRYDGYKGTNPVPFVQFTSPTPGTYNNRKPVLSNNIPDQTWTEDNNQNIDLNNYFTDADNDTLNYTTTSANNITVNVAGSTMTFTPDANFFGTRTITVTASDSLISTASNQFTLNITAVNDLPAVNIPTVNFPEGGSTSINLDTYTTDPDTPLNQINWTRIGGDSNIGVSINPTTHQATFNATQDYSGLTAVILNAQDTNVSSTNVTVNVNVNGSQDAPVITLTSPADQTNLNATSVNLQWTASDPDNDPLTYYLYHSNSSTPAFLNTTTNNQYSISNLINGQTYHWYVVASDNNTNTTSSSRQYTIAVNQNPQITSYTPTTTEVTVVKNNTQDFNVTVNDVDNHAMTHLWTLNSNSVSTTTGYNFNSTNYADGNYLLNYTVTDTFPSSTTQLWNITVRTRSAPVFSGPMPYVPVDEGSSATIDLSTYFSDPNNDTLTFTASSANDITVTISNNMATIVPASGFFGSRGITFNATDGLDTTSSNVVLVLVKKSNDAPTITYYTPNTFLVKEADNKEISFRVEADDADSDPFNFKWYVDNELQAQTSGSSYNLNEYPNQFISSGYFNGQVIVGGGSNSQEVLSANRIINSLIN